MEQFKIPGIAAVGGIVVAAVETALLSIWSGQLSGLVFLALIIPVAGAGAAIWAWNKFVG